MLNYDSLTQRIIFAAIVNVTGDVISQKFILKQAIFLLTYYVPDVLIIYIYEVCMALIMLLFLLFYIENSYKKAFLVKIVFLIGEGRINFLGG